ncbi:MAG: hypothetical protein LLG00_00280 [Planctomycetaceae bacterium]|nr:hypothetical protein [Planctomycetaceae bacterium]
MWRAFFLAIGFFVILLGVECLGVERMTLTVHDDPPPASSPFESAPTIGPQKQIVPPPWAPWSLLSSGAVMCIYSFTLPRRVGG